MIENESSYQKEYRLAVISSIIDYLPEHLFHSLMKYIFKEYYGLLQNKDSNENSNHTKEYQSILKTVEKYMITFEEIGGINRKYKHIYIGYCYMDKYYILKSLNESPDLEYKNFKKSKISLEECGEDMKQKIKRYQYQENKMKNKESLQFPLLYGRCVYEKDKKTNTFKIVNRTKEKAIKTHKGTISKKSEIVGRGCSTYKIPELLKMREYLQLYPLEHKKKIEFLCHDIEIFLRMKQFISEKNNSNETFFLYDF